MPLSRRQLLRSAAIAPALGALAALSPSAPAHQLAQPAEPPALPPKRTLRKAAMIGMVATGAETESLRDKFQLLRDCGFEGVEVDSPTTIEQQEVLEAAAATGLIVHGVVNSIHWRLPLNHPSDRIRDQALQGLETCLRDAAAFGASSILLVPGVVNDDMPYDECYQLSQEQIRKVIPLARELKVTIAVENVWNGFLLSPLEAARYVDDFGDPMVAFHFDIGNVINFGRPAQWIRILGNRIAKLHIKDFNLKARDEKGLWKGFDVELGEGNADWPGVMKALDAIGYSTAPQGRWATAEVRGGDRARLQQISDQMDRLFTL